MKRVYIILFPLLILMPAISFAQDKKDKNLPKKDIKVNREYDEDGNLIRYDSTYVYSWSSDSTRNFIPDSTFWGKMDVKKMQEYMNRFFKRDSAGHDHFRHPFFSDDFFDRDFFNPQFFGRDFNFRDSTRYEFFKNFEDMMKGHNEYRNERMDDMNRELDSLRNDFLKQRNNYYQKRDSIYRKHRNNTGDTMDI